MAIQRYGRNWPDDVSELDMHVAIYLSTKDPVERYEHMVAGMKLWIPETLETGERGFVWSEWDEEGAKAWCGVYSKPDEQADIRITAIGSGGSGKTTRFAAYALWHFCCDPLRTSIRVATNTKECLQDRTWREIERLWSILENRFGAGALPGRMIPSETKIEAGPEGYIRGIAIKQGTVEAAIGSVKGAHGPMVIVICDELDQMPIGVVEAIENASKACERFIFVGIGNPRRRYGNPLGEMCVPRSGKWRDCNVTMTWWETKHGICIYYDGLKSPGIRDPKKYGKFLITKAQIEKTLRIHGDKSPIYWEQCRGFFPPEGLTNSVLDEPTIIQYGFQDEPKIAGEVVNGLFVDPSYSLGGDRCMVQPFGVGPIWVVPQKPDEKSSENALQAARNLLAGHSAQRSALILYRQEQIQLELSDNVSLSDSIAKGMLALMRKYDVKPENCGADCSGSQGAIVDVVEQSVGKGVLRVFNSGKAGNAKLDEGVRDAQSKGKRVFVNCRAEDYYAFRMFGRAGQIRGLENETAIELTQTEWKSRSFPYQVEAKEEIKDRIGSSPDRADAAVGALRVARYRMGLRYLSGIETGKKRGGKPAEIPGDREADPYEGEPDYAAYQTAV